MTESFARLAVAVLSFTIIFSASSVARTNANPKIDLTARTSKAAASQAKRKSAGKVKMEDSINGVWAGEHITMQITENGASIEYDCAHGSIDQKITLDKNKRFVAAGTHAEEHGGPIRRDEPENGFPVRFAGQIKGKEMKLTVSREDDKEVIGSFKLIQGRSSRLVKCR